MRLLGGVTKEKSTSRRSCPAAEEGGVTLVYPEEETFLRKGNKTSAYKRGRGSKGRLP